MEDIQSIKQRFDIIGNSIGINRAIDIAKQVAPTDLSVLITGESGVGKEVFPRIIHTYSARKHASYIAVNCGAIPEGTIDSELFGHEKGAFTGALSERKGYFEVTNGGTIFLDEVGELPMPTQSRLLRMLESGEFIRVGSSKVQKADVRVIAATNLDIPKAIKQGKFREDLYYRLNTIPINIPPLRNRTEDIPLLFRRFAVNFAERYRMPSLKLTDDAIDILLDYRWPGNIRQLKNITEQISIIENERIINAITLKKYIPTDEISLPMLAKNKTEDTSFANEREILYKILFDMKKDMNDLKKLVYDIINDEHKIEQENIVEQKSLVLRDMYKPEANKSNSGNKAKNIDFCSIEEAEAHIIDESLSLQEKEKEMIIKALKRHNGKRNKAANELGISERTLYRKLKEYNID